MDALIETFKARLGEGGVLCGADAADQAQGLGGRFGKPLAVLRPATTEDVSFILRACNASKRPVVPWGGKTGLVAGANADGELALSLERMNKIEDIDRVASTMTVQAGAVLQTVCETAEAEGLLFPLDLGARGSATIGGNISTNAGGNRVIRYGMTRDLVLGLEAVLADGTVLSSLNHLIKNNTGYDLKQLFIGSEGTLGVVTRAVLRLQPKPSSQNTAFVAVESFDKLPRLLSRMKQDLGGTLSAFEVLWEDFYKLVTTAPAKGAAPLAHGHPYYVLIEALGSHQTSDGERFEQVLAAALENDEVSDAVVAKSQSEIDRMWALRDDVRQVGRNAPISVFDVSLAISQMESYVAELRDVLKSRWTAPSLIVFGHLGDGNLHVIVGVGDGSKEVRHTVEEIVYGALRKRSGSVSAEHGIGIEKRAYLEWCRGAEEIALMRTLKRALDPNNILNPGKIFAA